MYCIDNRRWAQVYRYVLLNTEYIFGEFVVNIILYCLFMKWRCDCRLYIRFYTHAACDLILVCVHSYLGTAFLKNRSIISFLALLYVYFLECCVVIRVTLLFQFPIAT